MVPYQTPPLDQESESVPTSELNEQSLHIQVLPSSPTPIPRFIPKSELNEQSLISGRVPVLLSIPAPISPVTSASVNCPQTPLTATLRNRPSFPSAPHVTSLGKRRRSHSLSLGERSKYRYPGLNQLASDIQSTLYPSPSPRSGSIITVFSTVSVAIRWQSLSYSTHLGVRS